MMTLHQLSSSPAEVPSVVACALSVLGHHRLPGRPGLPLRRAGDGPTAGRAPQRQCDAPA
jgi:hypothetical protein